LVAGTYNGLFVAPAEQHMGEIETVALGASDVVLTLK
jgi:hypothetical protein